MDKQENVLAISVEEMGRRMNLSRCGAYRLVRADGFPAVRVGGRIVVPVRELENWLADQVQRKGAINANAF